MRRIFMMLCAFCALAACDVAPETMSANGAEASADVVAADVVAEASPRDPSVIEDVTYDCAGMFKLQAAFYQKHVSITLPDGGVIDLPIAVSGSGFRYATAKHELRGKGHDATWTVGRRMPIECRVDGQPVDDADQAQDEQSQDNAVKTP